MCAYINTMLSIKETNLDSSDDKPSVPSLSLPPSLPLSMFVHCSYSLSLLFLFFPSLLYQRISVALAVNIFNLQPTLVNCGLPAHWP